MSAAKTRMSEQARYSAHIAYSEDDKGFIATAPDLPGCSAFGETQAEALSELQHAITAWIAAAKAAGNPVPEPSPAKVQPQPSGKLLLRIPRTLHGQLIDEAKREGTSLNQHMVYLLTYASAFKTTGATLSRATFAQGIIPQMVVWTESFRVQASTLLTVPGTPPARIPAGITQTHQRLLSFDDEISGHG
jgi:predicted RNase H-like HicB family nuclease